jgi:ketosteroid isomerase-like protein
MHMGNTKALDVVMEFITRINAGDPHSLSELMTEDHVFQDPLGKRYMGRETMIGGWKAYFDLVSDYRIRAEEFFQTDLRFAIFGSASGAYSRGEKRGKDGFWEVPAAWRALVRGELVAEWRVYADNQPLRKLMGEGLA